MSQPGQQPARVRSSATRPSAVSSNLTSPVSTSRKPSPDAAPRASATTGSPPAPASRIAASARAGPGSPREAAHSAWRTSCRVSPVTTPIAAGLNGPSHTSPPMPNGACDVTSTATGAATTRPASTATASGPPRSRSSTTISRRGPEHSATAAPSRSRSRPQSAGSASRRAASSPDPPASRTSCAHTHRPARPAAGVPRRTSNPRRRARSTAASASAVRPEPAGPATTKTPPDPPPPRSSRLATSPSTRRRSTRSTTEDYFPGLIPGSTPPRIVSNTTHRRDHHAVRVTIADLLAGDRGYQVIKQLPGCARGRG